MQRVVTAICVLVFAVGARADQSEIVTIDVGAFRNAAFGVNSLGWVVGDYSLNRDESANGGYLWVDGRVTLIDVPHASTTRPMAINDAGDIVGWWSENNTEHGFLYRDGSYTSFDVPGSVFTDAGGIDNAGDIVGTYCAATKWTNKCDFAPGSVRAFLLRDGVFSTLDIRGAAYTEGWATNGAQVAGRYAGTDGVFHAYRLTLATGAVDVIDVPGAAETSSQWWGFGGGIDDAGEVVGSFCAFEPCTVDNSSSIQGWQFEEGDIHGYIWSPRKSTQIDVPGAILSSLFGVSASGDYVAGTYFTSPFLGGEHGYVLRRRRP